jgi:hypothetical protein
MALKVNGLKVKSNRNLVIGITDKETVKLDFDDTPLDVVKYWTFRAMKWFKLQGFDILESSKKEYTVKDGEKPIFKLVKKSYHVIFNRKVSWKKNVHIIDWVAIESQIQKLKDYALMQGIKEGSTLRVSQKNDKPSPKVVYRYGKQDGQIKEFLSYRRMAKGIIRNCDSEKETAIDYN